MSRLFKYALTASLLLWIKRRSRRIGWLMLLVLMFFLIGGVFNEVREVYPRKLNEELMTLYGVKLLMQALIVVVGVYLVMGLFKSQNPAESLSPTSPPKQDVEPQLPLVVQTRAEYLIQQKKEQKHEQNL
jgi:hypothetical protein